MYKTLHGLVLREVKYKESSKMLTILTEEEGKLSCEARGALRKGSRIMAASQQGCYSEMTLFENRGRCLLTEASVIEPFAALRERFEDYALAVYVAEVLEAVSDEDSPNVSLLRLGLNTLYALSRELHPSGHIKAVFELRAACLAGFAPELGACAVCGRAEPEHPKLSLEGGIIHCGDCLAPSGGRSVSLSGAALAAMRYVVHADAKRIFSFSLDEGASERFSRASEEYLLTQLDRRFSSLDYWRSIASAKK